MKKIIPIIISGIFILSGFGAIGSPKIVTSNSEEIGSALLNNPPSKPTNEGPSIGAVNWSYCFNLTAQDPEYDDIYYFVDWSDGTFNDWFGPYNSGEIVIVCHNYTKPGYYSIIVKARDDTNAESEWSDPFQITIVENEAPLGPEINGPKSGSANKRYEWTFEAIDTDGDDIEFYICWGGTCVGRWYGPYASGEVVTKGYTYIEEGTFTIVCTARDIYGVEGPTASIEVIMPKNKAIESLFLYFLYSRPNLLPLLRMLLQRFEQ